MLLLFLFSPFRLFWSDDERFLKQFKAGDLKARFKSYSKFPPCFKDMAFWISPEFTENNLCELVRGESTRLHYTLLLILTVTCTLIILLQAFNLLGQGDAYSKRMPLLLYVLLLLLLHRHRRRPG
jgi:hypothetical protein